MSVSMPKTVRACLDDLQARYTTILAANLVGMYVHGSIAMGCFKPDSSDIDVLVVARERLPLATRARLGQAHVALADLYPHDIELSVIAQACLVNFTHPTPYEFHYSDYHREAFVNQTIDLSVDNTDYDLAAHFVITRAYGIALVGPPAHDVFPEIPPHAYWDSIMRDAAWSFDNVMGGSDEGVCPVPKYAVLNSCRVLAYIYDGSITSKQTGAEWALNLLPEAHHPVIHAALREYQKSGSAQPVNCRELKAFARYADALMREYGNKM